MYEHLRRCSPHVYRDDEQIAVKEIVNTTASLFSPCHLHILHRVMTNIQRIGEKGREEAGGRSTGLMGDELCANPNSKKSLSHCVLLVY